MQIVHTPSLPPHRDGLRPATTPPRASNYRSSLPPNLLRWGVFTLDLVVATLIASHLLYQQHQTVLDVSVRVALPYILIPVVATLGLTISGAYRLGFARAIDVHLIRAINGAGAGLLSLGSLIFYVSSSPGKYLVPILLTWAIISALHLCYVVLMKRLFSAGHLSEKVIIIGATQKAENLILESQINGDMQVLGIFDDRLGRAPDMIGNVPVIGGLNDLMTWDRLPEVDRIIVTVTSDARDRVTELIDQLRVLPHRIVLLLDLARFKPEDTTNSMSHVGQTPAAYVSGSPHDISRAIVKRLSDIVFASLLLAGFAPVMLLCAILIKLEDGGPVFFRQLRQGFNNELIRVWKFRSMRPDNKAADRMTAQTTSDDPRVTRIGRFIRTASIDELPQLFNVLRGEMSLVGPRPHAVGMTAESTMVQEIVGEYAHRHRAKPGITGWAQVNGSRGPVHTHAGVRERVRLDMEYLKRSSFFFDIYIMLMTAPCLLGDYKVDR